MSKFGKAVTGAIVGSFVGALFGEAWVLLGALIGLAVGIKSAENEANGSRTERQESDLARAARWSADFRERLGSTSTHASSNNHGSAGKPLPTTVDRGIGSSLPLISAYELAVPELMAACIAAAGAVEESEIETAIALLENDELVTDKKAALEALHRNIEQLGQARQKSKAVFKLKVTTSAHQARAITDDLQRDRILAILEGMLESTTSHDRRVAHEFIDKIRQIWAAAPRPVSAQEAAETFILKSGDREAIAELKAMKANPSRYRDRFKQAAQGNSVMRTALGVFTGVIAADLVTSAIYQSQLSEALLSFDAEIARMGGLENLSLGDSMQSVDFPGAHYVTAPAECEPDAADVDLGTGDDTGIESDGGGADFDSFFV